MSSKKTVTKRQRFDEEEETNEIKIEDIASLKHQIDELNIGRTKKS